MAIIFFNVQGCQMTNLLKTNDNLFVYSKTTEENNVTHQNNTVLQ